jgi:hypothetical protein
VRDPLRIDTILSKIALLWKRDTDLRLGQLLVNLVGDPKLGNDIFYVEDDDLEEALDHRLRELGVRFGGGFRLEE